MNGEVYAAKESKSGLDQPENTLEQKSEIAPKQSSEVLIEGVGSSEVLVEAGVGTADVQRDSLHEEIIRVDEEIGVEAENQTLFGNVTPGKDIGVASTGDEVDVDSDTVLVETQEVTTEEVDPETSQVVMVTHTTVTEVMKL